MPQYYNMTMFSNNDGFISFIRTLSEASNYWFGLMMYALIFLIPLIVMIRRNEEPNTSFMVSSLFALVAGAVFYMAGIVPNGLVFYIPMLILVTTVAIRVYNSNK